eukprot:gene48243-42676_t
MSPRSAGAGGRLPALPLPLLVARLRAAACAALPPLLSGGAPTITAVAAVAAVLALPGIRGPRARAAVAIAGAAGAAAAADVCSRGGGELWLLLPLLLTAGYGEPPPSPAPVAAITAALLVQRRTLQSASTFVLVQRRTLQSASTFVLVVKC